MTCVVVRDSCWEVGALPLAHHACPWIGWTQTDLQLSSDKIKLFPHSGGSTLNGTSRRHWQQGQQLL